MCHVPLGPLGSLLRKTDSTIKTIGYDIISLSLERILWPISSHPILEAERMIRSLLGFPGEHK